MPAVLISLLVFAASHASGQSGQACVSVVTFLSRDQVDEAAAEAKRNASICHYFVAEYFLRQGKTGKAIPYLRLAVPDMAKYPEDSKWLIFHQLMLLDQPNAERVRRYEELRRTDPELADKWWAMSPEHAAEQCAAFIRDPWAVSHCDPTPKTGVVTKNWQALQDKISSIRHSVAEYEKLEKSAGNADLLRGRKALKLLERLVKHGVTAGVHERRAFWQLAEQYYADIRKAKGEDDHSLEKMLGHYEDALAKTALLKETGGRIAFGDPEDAAGNISRIEKRMRYRYDSKLLGQRILAIRKAVNEETLRQFRNEAAGFRKIGFPIPRKADRRIEALTEMTNCLGHLGLKQARVCARLFNEIEKDGFQAWQAVASQSISATVNATLSGIWEKFTLNFAVPAGHLREKLRHLENDLSAFITRADRTQMRIIDHLMQDLDKYRLTGRSVAALNDNFNEVLRRCRRYRANDLPKEDRAALLASATRIANFAFRAGSRPILNKPISCRPDHIQSLWAWTLEKRNPAEALVKYLEALANPDCPIDGECGQSIGQRIRALGRRHEEQSEAPPIQPAQLQQVLKQLNFDEFSPREVKVWQWLSLGRPRPNDASSSTEVLPRPNRAPVSTVDQPGAPAPRSGKATSVSEQPVTRATRIPQSRGDGDIGSLFLELIRACRMVRRDEIVGFVVRDIASRRQLSSTKPVVACRMNSIYQESGDLRRDQGRFLDAVENYILAIKYGPVSPNFRTEIHIRIARILDSSQIHRKLVEDLINRKLRGDGIDNERRRLLSIIRSN